MHKGIRHTTYWKKRTVKSTFRGAKADKRGGIPQKTMKVPEHKYKEIFNYFSERSIKHAQVQFPPVCVPNYLRMHLDVVSACFASYIESHTSLLLMASSSLLYSSFTMVLSLVLCTFAICRKCVHTFLLFIFAWENDSIKKLIRSGEY